GPPARDPGRPPGSRSAARPPVPVPARPSPRSLPPSAMTFRLRTSYAQPRGTHTARTTRDPYGTYSAYKPAPAARRAPHA
ncbi:hypothetical protein ABGT92_35880, partial [Streptomyces cinereoruber]